MEAIQQKPLADDPLWYKDAVIYELHVRAFADSTGADRLALAAIQRAGLPPAPDLTQVRVPVLVIVGRQDVLVGNPSKLAAAIPGARAVVVSGDHLSAVYDPRFTAEVIAFLDEVRASA